jgi:hypothetical protein
MSSGNNTKSTKRAPAAATAATAQAQEGGKGLEIAAPSPESSFDPVKLAALEYRVRRLEALLDVMLIAEKEEREPETRRRTPALASGRTRSVRVRRRLTPATGASPSSSAAVVEQEKEGEKDKVSLDAERSFLNRIGREADSGGLGSDDADEFFDEDVDVPFGEAWGCVPCHRLFSHLSALRAHAKASHGSSKKPAEKSPGDAPSGSPAASDSPGVELPETCASLPFNSSTNLEQLDISDKEICELFLGGRKEATGDDLARVRRHFIRALGPTCLLCNRPFYTVAELEGHRTGSDHRKRRHRLLQEHEEVDSVEFSSWDQLMQVFF